MKYNFNSSTIFFLLPGVCYLTELIVWLSFPNSYFLNGVLGGLWSLGQIGILFILNHLYRFKIADGKNWKILGVAIAALGAISYLINYIFGYWFHLNTRLFLPLGALLTGIGMVITGIQVIASGRWRGIGGKIPLIVGLYPFMVMFPLLIIQGRPDLLAIMGWGIPWLFLGLAINTAKRKRVRKKVQQISL